MKKWLYWRNVCDVIKFSKKLLQTFHQRWFIPFPPTIHLLAQFYRDKSRVYPTIKNERCERRNWKERLQQSEGRNRCNPIDILWEYFCTAGGIYKGNLRRIERNRRLMPSRRFLTADLKTHSRCSRGNRSISATICLVSMIESKLPGIVTFWFRELLPQLHQLSYTKGCDLIVEPY